MYINDLIEELKKIQCKYGNVDVLIERMDIHSEAIDDAEEILGFEYFEHMNTVVICNNGYIE